MFFCLVSSTSAAALSLFIYSRLNIKSYLSYCIINLSVIISVTNVWFTNILTFPECIFISGFGVAFCFLSIIRFFTEAKHRLLSIVIAAIMLIFSIAIYQQFLTVFIIYSILLSFIKITGNSRLSIANKLFIYLRLCVFLIISLLFYYGISLLIQSVFSINSNPRASLNFDSIINNIIYCIKKQRYIIGGKGFFNSGLLRRCFEVVIVIWLIVISVDTIKNRRINNIYAFITFPMAYCSAFIMVLISTGNSPRTFFGLFSVFALFSIGAIALKESRIIKGLFIIILGLVFFLNSLKTLDMALDQQYVNSTEITMAKIYMKEIERYESTSKRTINKIVFTNDNNSDMFMKNRLSESALSVDWGIQGIMEYLYDREFSVTRMSNDERINMFGENDWKEYIAEKQIRFSKDTMYLCLY